MAEIPESWGLKTERDDVTGHLNVIGKDDLGQEYVAYRATKGYLDNQDLANMKLGDRESTSAKELVEELVRQKANHDAEKEATMLEEYTEAALPAAEAGCGHRSFWMGSSYERGQQYFKWKESLGL